jgi:hypothetical protein
MSFRPVYNPVQDLVRNTLEAKRVQLEQERLEQEKELRLKELAQNKELTSKQLDLEASAHELTRTIQEQAINKEYLTSGATPAGTKETRGVTGVTGDPNKGFNLKNIGPNGMGDNDVQLNVPNIGIFQTQTPEAASARAGHLGLLREEPLLKKQAELQQDITDRSLSLEHLRSTAAEQLKRIEMESADKRAESANAARKYVADTTNQARIKAAEIAAGKMSGTQQTAFTNLTDMEDALKKAMATLGDFNDKSSNWYKYFTNSNLDETARNNPTASKFIPSSPMDSKTAADLKVLDTALLDKGKYNSGIQKIMATGLTSSRNQDPKQAKDNLDSLLYQIQQEKLNIVNPSKSKDPLNLFN